jgi:hypothetical protein
MQDKEKPSHKAANGKYFMMGGFAPLPGKLEQW